MKNLVWIIVGIFFLFSCNDGKVKRDTQKEILVQSNDFLINSDIDQMQVVNDSLCLVNDWIGGLYLCNYQNGIIIRQFDFAIDDSLLLKKYFAPVARNIKLLYPSQTATIPVISDMPHYKTFGIFYSTEQSKLLIGYYPKMVYVQKNDTVCDYVPFILESDLSFSNNNALPIFLNYNPDSMASVRYFTNTCNHFFADKDYIYVNNTPYIINKQTPFFLTLKRVKTDSVAFEKSFGKYPDSYSNHAMFKHAFEKFNGTLNYSNEEAIYTMNDSLVFEPKNLKKGIDKIWGFHQTDFNKIYLYISHIDTSDNYQHCYSKVMCYDFKNGNFLNEKILFQYPVTGEAAFYGNKIICLMMKDEKCYFVEHELE
jgi:hypothetical protein